jgi:ATP-dependent DNA helicase RecQ
MPSADHMSAHQHHEGTSSVLSNENQRHILCSSVSMESSVCQMFGVETFNSIQSESLRQLSDGKDVFLSIRTGGGKSLVYQAFPLLRDERCQVLIISPLLSIMKEQVWLCITG